MCTAFSREPDGRIDQAITKRMLAVGSFIHRRLRSHMNLAHVPDDELVMSTASPRMAKVSNKQHLAQTRIKTNKPSFANSRCTS